MTTAADWLLLAMSVVVFVAFVSVDLIGNELLNYIVGAVFCALTLVGCESVKPYVTGKRSVGTIDADIKNYYYQKYKSIGKLP